VETKENGEKNRKRGSSKPRNRRAKKNRRIKKEKESAAQNKNATPSFQGGKENSKREEEGK